jgi:L-rhamnose-H+ transport protein
MLATLVGIMSAMIAGLLNGSFAVPMKRTIRWEWENTWLMWAVWALIIVPWLLTVTTIPEPLSVYRNSPSGVLIRTFLFGAGWGCGAVTFGLGLYMVGLSLGFSVIIGITAVTGALIPMLVVSPASILTVGGMVIILAMLVTVGGVGLCGLAGIIREGSRLAGSQASFQDRQSESADHFKFKWGFLVCLASGVLNAMLNLAFVFGSPIAEVAKTYLGQTGVSFRANNAIWSLALLGAFITNLLYCGMLLLRKGSWKKYSQPGTGIYWFWTFLMGTIWMSGVALYGAGASSLGKLGATVAWIILMATTVLVGNVWGILSGEWKGTPKKARQRMVQGLILLVSSIVLVSLGRYLID